MNIAVIGMGTTGTGIAQVAALAGNAVVLYDISPQAVQRAQIHIAKALEEMISAGQLDYEKAAHIRTLIGSTTVLEHCGEATIAIECVPEQLDLKKALIERLDSTAPQSTILATCVKLLSVSAIASAAQKFPERVIGMKFFAPLPSTHLVEIIRAAQTAAAAVDRAVLMAQSLNKETVLVKDTPGFLVERIADMFTSEALHMLEEGHTDLETIDRLMKSLDFDPPPFRLIDHRGLDQTLTEKQALFDATGHEPRFRPSLLLQKMMQSGLLGHKTKQGFYHYDE